MKATIITRGPDIVRVIHDVIALDKPCERTTVTHQDFVHVRGGFTLVGAMSADASVWYDLWVLHPRWVAQHIKDNNKSTEEQGG